MAQANFTVDATTVIPNPERGFFDGTSGGLLASTSQFASDLTDIFNATTGLTPVTPMRICRATCDLGPWKTSNIAGTFDAAAGTGTGSLGTMAANLAALRSHGIKAFLLFAYDFSGVTNPDTSLAWMQVHMNQLKPMLEFYKDVIYYISAGFIGMWGEWHTSGSSGMDSKANKRAVHLALQLMTPPGVPLLCTQVYPMQEDWFSGMVLNDANAFSGSDMSRWGFENDCFMAGPDDSFNYPNAGSVIVDFTTNATQLQKRQYVAAISEYAPFGGETCDNSSGSGSMRTQCASGVDGAGLSAGILNEGPRYHLSILNGRYAPAFLTAWNSNGCWTQTCRSIGYRIEVRSVSHADSVTPGSTLKVTVYLRNTGWARVHSAWRRLQVRLRNGGTTIKAKSSAQLRQLPSQMTSDLPFVVNIPIPVNASAGDYTVHVDMEDEFAATQARAFKIRPAVSNSGGQQWDDSNGWLTTGTAVSVGTGAASGHYFLNTITSTMWSEYQTKRAAYPPTGGYTDQDAEALVASIPTSGGTTLSPGATGAQINTAISGNSVVYLNGGTYSISIMLELLANKKLIGVAGQTVNIDCSANLSNGYGIHMMSNTMLVNVNFVGCGGLGVYVDETASGFFFYKVSMQRVGQNPNFSDNIRYGNGFHMANGAHTGCLVSCEAFQCYDTAGTSTGPGGNADGYRCGTAGGGNITMVDCWARECSDDGFDMWECVARNRLFFCHAERQGKNPIAPTQGDGNGYKLGGPADGSNNVPHYLYKCATDDNAYFGFNWNGNIAVQIIEQPTTVGDDAGAYAYLGTPDSHYQVI